MKSTEGQVLPLADEDRAFALVRHWAIRSASEVEVASVLPDGAVDERARVRVASRAALLALKTVSIARRGRGHYPQKVSSDIQDLYRQITSQGLEEIPVVNFHGAFPVANQRRARFETSAKKAGWRR